MRARRPARGYRLPANIDVMAAPEIRCPRSSTPGIGSGPDAQRPTDAALVEYQAGTVAYTSVVTAQQALITDQQTALTIQQNRLVASVTLIEVLGGGWEAKELKL